MNTSIPDLLAPARIPGQNPNTPEGVPRHTAYYTGGSPADFVRTNKGTIFTLVVLLGLVAWAVWTMVQMWVSIEGEMGTHEFIAMFLGVFFSCLVGFGLMALMFYSSRKGYDEAPSFTREDDDDPRVR